MYGPRCGGRDERPCVASGVLPVSSFGMLRNEMQFSIATSTLGTDAERLIENTRQPKPHTHTHEQNTHKTHNYTQVLTDAKTMSKIVRIAK